MRQDFVEGPDALTQPEMKMRRSMKPKFIVPRRGPNKETARSQETNNFMARVHVRVCCSLDIIL